MRVPYIIVRGTISLVLLSACSKLATLTGATTVAVASVVVTPASTTIVSGSSAQLSAATYDAGGQQLTGRVVTWTTTNATVASASSTGLVSAGAAGSATVTATSEGKSGTAVITVSAAQPPPPPSSIADPTLLPIAARQLPQFESYPGASLAAGMSYSDPVTGVRVWKATSASVPVANTQATHDYGSGPLQVTRDWGTNQHTILVNVGGHYLVDFTRGVGFSNWRRTPAVNSDLCFTFSFVAATPQIAYFLNGTTLHRYDTRTNTVADSGNFPKSFASITSSSLLWLQQDRNDEWFVMMPGDQSLVIAWNSVTNVTQVIHATSLDEPHLDRDGRYVAIDLTTGAPDWQIYDLQTQSMGAPISKQAHLEALRSAFVAHNPDISSGPQYYYDPVAGQQVTTLTASQLSPDLQHRSGQWIQSAAQLPGMSLLKQWYLWSGYSDGVVSDGGWSLSSGQIYWTTPNWTPAYAKATIGVQSVRQLVDGAPTRVARQLTRVSSVAAMTEGSFYYDAAATRVYVWTVGGGSPTGRVELRAPATIHDGIGFVRQDGSDVRLLAHHYSHSPNRYWDTPRATVSADGKVVLFSSNQNDSSGRIDLYVIEVPIH
jgi:hypothetical protein